MNEYDKTVEDFSGAIYIPGVTSFNLYSLIDLLARNDIGSSKQIEKVVTDAMGFAAINRFKLNNRGNIYPIEDCPIEVNDVIGSISKTYIHTTKGILTLITREH